MAESGQSDNDYGGKGVVVRMMINCYHQWKAEEKSPRPRQSVIKLYQPKYFKMARALEAQGFDVEEIMKTEKEKWGE